MQATLNKMESLYKSPKNTKAETKTVIDNSVAGIETPLDTMSIALQDGRERDQRNPSGHIDNATPPFDKGKAKDSTPREPGSRVFDNWIRTPIRTAKVYNIPLMTTPKLPKEN